MPIEKIKEIDDVRQIRGIGASDLEHLFYSTVCYHCNLQTDDNGFSADSDSQSQKHSITSSMLLDLLER